MSHLITIEQAVEAVRSFLDRSNGQQVYPSAPYWVERIVDALRALPPAEATEEEVERVARAIYGGYWGQFATRYENEDRVLRTNCENAARAALAALKQPGGKER